MSKVFHRLHVHLVWSTSGRMPLLSEDMRQWLWPALAEKARQLGSTYVVVGGTDDHVHVLTEFAAAQTIADVARNLKGASTRLVRLRGTPEFAWQQGYGAFAVSHADLARVEQYIRHQREHHAAGTHDHDLEVIPQPVPKGLLEL